MICPYSHSNPRKSFLRVKLEGRSPQSLDASPSRFGRIFSVQPEPRSSDPVPSRPIEFIEWILVGSTVEAALVVERPLKFADAVAHFE